MLRWLLLHHRAVADGSSCISHPESCSCCISCRESRIFLGILQLRRLGGDAGAHHHWLLRLCLCVLPGLVPLLLPLLRGFLSGCRIGHRCRRLEPLLRIYHWCRTYSHVPVRRLVEECIRRPLREGHVRYLRRVDSPRLGQHASIAHCECRRSERWSHWLGWLKARPRDLHWQWRRRSLRNPHRRRHLREDLVVTWAVLLRRDTHGTHCSMTVWRLARVDMVVCHCGDSGSTILLGVEGAIVPAVAVMRGVFRLRVTGTWGISSCLVALRLLACLCLDSGC